MDKANYQLICKSSLGDELAEAECQVLAGIMGVHRLQEGEMLVKEGEANCGLYLLAQGALAVISNTGGLEAVVYVMKEGECAGTRAFVDRTPRKATLRADGEAVEYSLTHDAFESLLEKHPQIVYTVMRALFRITHSKLMRMNQESQQLSNNISITHGRY